MSVPYQAVEEVFALLEKSAADNDALDQDNVALRLQLSQLERKLGQAPPPVKQAAFAADTLRKAAEVLVTEGLVPAGYDLEKTAAAIAEDPNRLLELAIKLASPAVTEGRPVKAATPKPLSGEPQRVRLGDHEVVDNDAWLNALTQR